jgi:hypothetical protein
VVKQESDVIYIISRLRSDLNSLAFNYNSIPIGSVVNSKICGEEAKDKNARRPKIEQNQNIFP